LVFTRSNGVWTQQGAKLAGTDTVGSAEQGLSVGLSSDGNTAVVGGAGDNNGVGAVWVFTRSNGIWTQQQKLVGTGTLGTAQQGNSVALSGDGNTVLVGGQGDNNFFGTAWVFTRSNGVWTQQGAKLLGTGAVGNANQGNSVALSADGNTAIVGGPLDNNFFGAAWVFTRSGGVWTQLGAKLVGTGAVGGAQQGTSVALSSDGTTAIVGGPFDNNNAGAGWVFVQPNAKVNPPATHNFNGDNASDIAWRDSSGNTAAWLSLGGGLFQAASFGVVPTNWQMVGQRDFNNDGKYDWLWRDGNTGAVAIWLLNGSQILQAGGLGAVSSNWQIAGTSDFNFDGKGDILWRDGNTGALALWLMNGLQVSQAVGLGTVPLTWTIAGTDDNGDIFWRDGNTGTLAIWQLYSFEVLQTVSLGAVPLNWVVVGTGDFDGNGSADIPTTATASATFSGVTLPPAPSRSGS
jgi:hypothetical protein